MSGYCVHQRWLLSNPVTFMYISKYSLNRLTHWKQDLLMLDTPFDVLPGDHVIGSVRLKRNRKWRRHITVTVTYQLTRSDQTLIVSDKKMDQFPSFSHAHASLFHKSQIVCGKNYLCIMKIFQFFCVFLSHNSPLCVRVCISLYL